MGGWMDEEGWMRRGCVWDRMVVVVVVVGEAFVMIKLDYVLTF